MLWPRAITPLWVSIMPVLLFTSFRPLPAGRTKRLLADRSGSYGYMDSFCSYKERRHVLICRKLKNKVSLFDLVLLADNSALFPFKYFQKPSAFVCKEHARRNKARLFKRYVDQILIQFIKPPARACLKIGDVSSSEGFWAAGKQFFRRNPGGFQGKIAPSRGQKTRRLGMLPFFKQALGTISLPFRTHSSKSIHRWDAKYVLILSATH